MAEPGRTNDTNIFGSPLMAHRWADAEALNGELKAAILRHAAATPGAARTNVGGWHSEYGELEFCGQAGKTLLDWARSMGDEATARVYREYGHEPRPMTWTVHAWANVNRAGDFNKTHTHPGSTWSGTYYVDTGYPPGDAGNTPLNIFDPCQGRANTFFPGVAPSNFSIRPEEGLMVLFPSYLAHTVFPHRADQPRISIAFNLRREPYP